MMMMSLIQNCFVCIYFSFDFSRVLFCLISFLIEIKQNFNNSAVLNCFDVVLHQSLSSSRCHPV